MSEDKVHYLGANGLPIRHPEKHAEFLRDVATRIEDGQISAYAIAIVDKLGTSITQDSYRGLTTLERLIGILQRLSVSMSNELNEKTEE